MPSPRAGKALCCAALKIERRLIIQNAGINSMRIVIALVSIGCELASSGPSSAPIGGSVNVTGGDTILRDD